MYFGIYVGAQVVQRFAEKEPRKLFCQSIIFE